MAAGGDLNAMTDGDPNAMGADPMAAGGADPMAGGEAPVGDDDSTAGIIDQLSDDDKEAVRNYAKSLLNRDEATPDEGAAPEMGGMEGAAAPAPGQEQGVMMEITKGRLKKIQKHINEKFRENDREEDRGERNQKKVHKKNPGSPFDRPVKW